jgi:hypothetical protein
MHQWKKVLEFYKVKSLKIVVPKNVVYNGFLPPLGIWGKMECILLS